MGVVQEGEHMADAKTAIENAFKDILKEKPYTKVTVSEVCTRAAVSRRSFYKYFDDKEDIVKTLFDEHVVRPMRDLHALLTSADVRLMQDSFIVRMYESLFLEREYYMNLVKPLRGHDDTFLRVVTWSIYDFNMRHIPAIGSSASNWRLDYMSYFFASSQAMFMQKWISDGMTIPPADLAELYSSMTMPFWNNLIG